MFSVENNDRKRIGRRKKLIQNKCGVSSQNKQYEKRRGRHRSGYTYLPSGETVPAGLVRAERAAILHGDNFTGKPHKIPQMSYLQNAGDFKTKQMKLKDADESENRLKTQKVTNVS